MCDHALPTGQSSAQLVSGTNQAISADLGWQVPLHQKRPALCGDRAALGGTRGPLPGNCNPAGAGGAGPGPGLMMKPKVSGSAASTIQSYEA